MADSSQPPGLALQLVQQLLHRGLQVQRPAARLRRSDAMQRRIEAKKALMGKRPY